MTALALAFEGWTSRAGAQDRAGSARPVWMFLGGFCWVVGDLFAQYGAKIRRHRPRRAAHEHQSTVGPGLGSVGLWRIRRPDPAHTHSCKRRFLIMIAGALAISFAAAPHEEHLSARSPQTRMRALRNGPYAGGGFPRWRRSIGQHGSQPTLVGFHHRDTRGGRVCVLAKDSSRVRSLSTRAGWPSWSLP